MQYISELEFPVKQAKHQQQKAKEIFFCLPRRHKEQLHSNNNNSNNNNNNNSNNNNNNNNNNLYSIDLYVCRACLFASHVQLLCHQIWSASVFGCSET